MFTEPKDFNINFPGKFLMPTILDVKATVIQIFIISPSNLYHVCTPSFDISYLISQSFNFPLTRLLVKIVENHQNHDLQ